MHYRAWASALFVAVVITTLAGCGGTATPVTSHVTPPPQAVKDTTVRHVVIVVLENKSYDQVIGSADMPFLNSLASRGTVMTNFYANGVDSLPNYFMMTVGDTITPDAGFGGTVHLDNIVRRLVTAGKSWKAYAESIPSTGYLGTDAPPYMKVHNPFAYFEDVQNSDQQANRIVPMGAFQTDIDAGSLPDYSFVIPNNSSNSHDCPPDMPVCDTADTLRYSDNWLKNHMQPLLDSPAWQNTLLIVTYDESEGDTTHGGGQVATILAGGKVKAGYKVTALHQHQSLLRLSLKALGINVYPGLSASAPDLDEAFDGSLP